MLKGLIYFLVITSFLSTAGYGQKQTHNWVFGYNNGISFNSGTPTLLNTQIRGREGCSSISDTTGQLMFYTDGIRVWDRAHTIMTNGGDLNGDSAATMSALITEYPGDKNRYYIFTVDTTSINPAQPSRGLQYSIVDMTLRAGMGDVTIKNQVLLPAACEKIVGIMHRNANDVWVIAHEYGNNRFVVYQITCNGLNTTPVGMYNLGRPIITPPNTIGYMRASPNGRKIATAGFTSVVEVFDFDDATGVMSNAREIPGNPLGLCGPYGLEFSPDSKLLYDTEIYACDGSGRFFLFQYQVDAPDILATVQTIATGNTGTGGSTTAGLLLGPDSIIYVALDNRPYLAAITNPNVVATGGNSPGVNGPIVGFVEHHFDLNGANPLDGSAGLPNMVAGYRTLLGKDSTMCFGVNYNLSLANIPNVTFLWDNTSTANNRTFTVSGKYWVRITNTITGCSYSDTVYLTFKPRPIVDIGPNQAICADKFPITLTQLQEPLATYVWNSGPTTGTSFIVTTAGRYYIDATLDGCTIADSVDVTSKAVTSFSLGNDTAICGITPLTLDPKIPFSSYNWNTTEVTGTIDVAATGLYWLEATNGVGCAFRDTINVLYKPNPVVSLGTDQSICADKFPITLTQATTAGYTYAWQDASITNTFNVTAAGIYWIDVTLNGCTIRDSVDVASRAVTSFTLGNDTAICGITPLTLDPKVPFSSYLWNDNSIGATNTISATGLFWLEATNGVGCAFRDTINVLYKPNPVVSLGTDQSICADKFPVTLTQAPSATYTYAWQNASTANTFTATGAGIYWIDVTLNGCTVRDSVDVASRAVTSFTLGNDTAICGITPLTLDPKVSFSSYLWNDNTSAATNTINGTGLYWLEATNGVGCAFRDTINVLYKPNPVVSLGTDQSICADKFPITLTQSPTAGYTYAWQNASTANTFTATGAGIYWIDVTLNGCTIRDSVDVTSRAVTSFTLGVDTSICGTTPLILNPKVSFSNYLWNDNTNGATNTINATGLYWLEATNGVGCAFRDTINVLYKPNPVVSLGTDQSICADKFPITLTQAPSATYTYAWQNTSTTNTFTATGAGIYWIDVTLNGCTVRDSVNVASRAVTSFTLGNDTAICGITPLTLDPKISFSGYNWNTSATTGTINVAGTGLYWLEATNGVGCSFRDTINVLYKPNPLVNLGVDQSICTDKFPVTLTQTSQPGVIYAWKDGTNANTLPVNTAGIYWIDATLNGCTVRDSVEITSRAVTTFDLGADREICGNAAQILTVNPAFATYAWNTGSIVNTTSVNTSGKYWADAVNAAGCKYTDTINVLFKPIPVVNIGTDQSVCENKFPVTLTQATIPGATYTWSNGSTNNTLPVNGAGTYRIDVDLNGCTDFKQVTVTTLPIPVFSLGPDTSICGSPEVILSIPAGFSSYVWNTGSNSNSININSTGTYSVTATNSFGCSNSDERIVTLNSALIFSLGKDTTLCPGTTLLLNVANVGDTYTWQDNSTASQFVVSAPGIYYVEVNKTGCVKSDTLVVKYSIVPQPNLGADMEICPGQQLLLDPKVVGKSYLWSDGSRMPTLTATAAGVYSVQIGSDCGITTDEIVISKGVCRLALPNAFTPDKATNNIFRLINGYELAEFKMEIYNRWGQLVFLSQNPAVGWNGTYRGVVQPSGGYVYAVSYIDDATGKKVMQRGTVILIR